ncbi:MAG: FAD-dependent oxidoreductase [Bacteroidetes bacterium]|nr:FAD-dependent oxidoreductase [Bacteroidota bacterium]
MAIEPWRTAKVIKIVNETHNTRRYWLQVPELDWFDFKPGQFVTLDLPIHEKKNKRWRSYSIASWPDGTNVFELVIVLLEDGAGTSYLFNQIKEGDELTFRGPQGVFTLPETLDTDFYLICTGTGIAPFRSMLHHIALTKTPHQNVYLVFGTRKKENLLYYDELTTLTAQTPGLHYIPVLSREDWEGEKGYVHEVYKKLVEKNKLGDQLPAAHFFLCGWKNMIDEAKQTITGLGYDRKAIHQELYG